MASPPYRSPAGSPPQPTHSILPGATARKRPQLSTPYSQPAKRRKASTYSAASGRGHPLRQASFPPEEAAADGTAVARSPSVESDYTAVTGVTGRQSVGTATAATAGHAAGRKSKGGRRRKTAGSVKSGSRVVSRARSTAAGGGEDEDEDDADEGDDDAGIDADGMVDEGGKVDRLAESKKMAVLVDAFSTDQAERYDTYRRIKLKKETLRRIVNQTLSQSVPPSVILTINGFAKVFIGTLVERALDVQAQSAKAAATTRPSPASVLPPPAAPAAHASTAKGDHPTTSPARAPSADHPPHATSPPLIAPSSFSSSSFTTSPPSRDAKPALGPLEPNHLREALRRYRKDGEGGGAGVEGFSVGLGIPGARAARLGGNRLFR